MLSFHLSLLIILVAALVNIVVGFFWYSQRGFGNAWMNQLGESMDELGRPSPGYLLALVAGAPGTVKAPARML